MKKQQNPHKYIPLLLFFFLLNFGYAQNSETLVYCINGDSIIIEKNNEFQNGDTLERTFSEDWSNTNFTIYTYNDSLFSKYNDQYYLIGANQANIGDIWNPLRYHFMSFSDSSTSCPNLMNVEVISISQVLFAGSLINSFELKDNDLELDVHYTFLEGIGVVNGGPLYNLKQQYDCDILFDFYEPYLLFYANDIDTLHFETECSGLSIDNLLMEEIKVQIDNSNGIISILNTFDQSIKIELFDLSGRLIASSNNSFLKINNLDNNLYYLKVELDKRLKFKLIRL